MNEVYDKKSEGTLKNLLKDFIDIDTNLEFKLPFCDITKLDKEIQDLIITYVSNSKSLKSLKLKGSKVSSEFIKELAKNLKENEKFFEKIDISIIITNQQSESDFL